ncbi:hypothetical protein ARMSODRAFT_1019575 [Armillaria solidipes]|uniref:Uncharacterized protein n=1 Tax=Armillaria solidipes TaxID=1076256 RepID=A0A2H3BC33_9AGAR|nr:hypothetical protein ARMSODRAFT_1019575 [Armillaria solidipes]
MSWKWMLSSSRYDHQDNHTLSMLFKRARAPHIITPLGHEKHFESIGIADGHMHTYNWLHHQGNTVGELSHQDLKLEGKKENLAGDTEYQPVKDGEDEAERPICPALKETGERFGGFDLAMISIGYVQFLSVFRDIDDRKIRDGPCRLYTGPDPNDEKVTTPL